MHAIVIQLSSHMLLYSTADMSQRNALEQVSWVVGVRAARNGRRWMACGRSMGDTINLPSPIDLRGGLPPARAVPLASSLLHLRVGFGSSLRSVTLGLAVVRGFKGLLLSYCIDVPELTEHPALQDQERGVLCMCWFCQ
jgi:hypothetical protein